MAFHHVPTFLKSALARNPFCHGDIISAEDVIRLESQFPILFDKPVKLEEDGKERVKFEEEPKKVVEPHPLKLSTSPATGKRTGNKLLNKTTPVERRLKSTASRFHRDCLPNPASLKGEKITHPTCTPSRKFSFHASKPKPAFSRASTSTNKLIRPAQSFSLENLKETLKEMMQEDSLSGRKFQRESPSPYTEDLVKKFLWRKLQATEVQCNGGDKEEMKGQGDATLVSNFISKYQKPRSNLRSFQVNNGKKLSLHTSAQPKVNVQRIQSAPGFLRSFPQTPIVSKMKSYAERNTHLSKKAAYGKHVTWEENSDKDGTVKVRCSNLQGSKICGTPVHPDAFREKPSATIELSQHVQKSNGNNQLSGTDLFSVRKPPPETLQRRNDFGKQLSATSFAHLLHARTEKSNFKTSESVQVQKNPLNVRVKHRQQHEQAGNGRSYDRDILREMRSLPTSTSKTKRTLEKIAEELVHMEILRQLNGIKQEIAVGGRGNLDKFSDTASLSSPNSPKSEPKCVPNTEIESEYKQVQQSEENELIILRTPELTPPSALLVAHNGYGKLGGLDLKEEIAELNLDTPDLSRSLRKFSATTYKNYQISKSASQHNLDTDCSEISDFILSETADNAHVTSDRKVSSANNASFQLATPQLSEYFPSVVMSLPTSLQSQRKPHQGDIFGKDKSATSDGSLISHSVLVSPSESKKIGKPKIGEDTHEKSKSSRQLSKPACETAGEESVTEESNNTIGKPGTDDIPTDRNIIYGLPSVQELADPNSSRDTVIDMLSEGEFLGAAYRSPGELSLRQKTRKFQSFRKGSEKLSISSTTLESFDGEESEVSFSSFGTQGRFARKAVSVGEYLQP